MSYFKLNLIVKMYIFVFLIFIFFMLSEQTSLLNREKYYIVSFVRIQSFLFWQLVILLWRALRRTEHWIYVNRTIFLLRIYSFPLSLFFSLLSNPCIFSNPKPFLCRLFLLQTLYTYIPYLPALLRKYVRPM